MHKCVVTRYSVFLLKWTEFKHNQAQLSGMRSDLYTLPQVPWLPSPKLFINGLLIVYLLICFLGTVECFTSLELSSSNLKHISVTTYVTRISIILVMYQIQRF